MPPMPVYGHAMHMSLRYALPYHANIVRDMAIRLFAMPLA